MNTKDVYQVPGELKLHETTMKRYADWTLFLDRDGVINVEKENDYIHTWDEFVYYDNAASTVAALTNLFGRTIIVTNQKGIGKGVSKEEDVQAIHTRLQEDVAKQGGKIDAVFYCPDTDSSSPNRKPNAGMAYQAKNMFSDINFTQSIMVGNNISDVQFGRNAGMKTAFVRTTNPGIVLPEGLADWDTTNLMTLLAAWTIAGIQI